MGMNLCNAAVAVAGMGLMGGSLGRALRVRNACRTVTALVRSDSCRARILELDAADRVTTDPKDLASADLVVLAAPVRAIRAMLAEFAPYFAPGSVVTDMGSVKRPIVEAMRDLPAHVHAVGGHPMCGKEISGVNASDPHLFVGAAWPLTPTTPDSDAPELVYELVRCVGARPMLMDAQLHDETVACISHLPYMLATTLASVARDEHGRNIPVKELAAGGFRDTSRVAAGSLDMMTDILLDNRGPVSAMLRSAHTRLGEFLELLESGDEERLRRTLEPARTFRSEFYR
jgi:prephenate dehydrogenase